MSPSGGRDILSSAFQVLVQCSVTFVGVVPRHWELSIGAWRGDAQFVRLTFRLWTSRSTRTSVAPGTPVIRLTWDGPGLMAPMPPT